MMDKRTADALEASIAHWEENVAAGTPKEARVRAADCALCGIFQQDGGCGDCPVRRRTETDFCQNSPYLDAAFALRQWFTWGSSSKPLWTAAARAEVDFLKSLREPVTTP